MKAVQCDHAYSARCTLEICRHKKPHRSGPGCPRAPCEEWRDGRHAGTFIVACREVRK